MDIGDGELLLFLISLNVLNKDIVAVLQQYIKPEMA